MPRTLTIILLALVMLGGTSAWAEIERNPGSRGGAERRVDNVERARPPEPPAAEEVEEQAVTATLPEGTAELLPPPLYLTTAELAQVESIVAGLQEAALAAADLAESAPAPVMAAAAPGPPAEPLSRPQFDFPESFGPKPAGAEPAMDVEPALEKDTPDTAARPERLTVYSSADYEDDARELAAQIQGSSTALTDEVDAVGRADEEPAPVDDGQDTPVVVEDEPVADREAEFHTNWQPNDTGAQRGLGGTRRELPREEPVAAEPVVPEPESAPLPGPPVTEDEPAPSAESADADVDSLFSDGYPLDALLGQEQTAPAEKPTPTSVTETLTPPAEEPVVTEPAESFDRPRLDTGTGRREWSFDDRGDPTVQANTMARGAFTPLLMESASRTRPPREPRLYLGDPAMPDWPVGSTVTSLSRGNPKRKQVALTFDDGPHPEFTSQLLSVLDFYDVPATFFFVGVQAQKYPHWVKMTHQAGHELANHTYDHFRLPKLPREEKTYQIDEFQRLVENLTGVTPRFLRPPGGRLDGETSAMLTDRGMVLALWDVAINDTYEGKTKDDTLGAALKNIRPGSVVLCHDGIQATVDMLPELITTLRAQGYEFVTLSEMASGL